MLKILNSRDVKHLKKKIFDQWHAEIEDDFVFLENEKGRIFVVSKGFSSINTEKVRIQSIGIYFAERNHEELRLSIEGSQIIGPYAKKNVRVVSDKEAHDWMQGNTLEKTEEKGFLIIKNKDDFLGSGKNSGTHFLNFVPKTRRTNVII